MTDGEELRRWISPDAELSRLDREVNLQQRQRDRVGGRKTREKRRPLPDGPDRASGTGNLLRGAAIRMISPCLHLLVYISTLLEEIVRRDAKGCTTKLAPGCSLPSWEFLIGLFGGLSAPLWLVAGCSKSPAGQEPRLTLPLRMWTSSIAKLQFLSAEANMLRLLATTNAASCVSAEES
jgi:hypothetical protein